MNDSSNRTVGHASKRARGFKGRLTVVPKPQPAITIKPDPLAWRTAVQLAGGDHSRCVAQSDGTVMIYNNSVR